VASDRAAIEAVLPHRAPFLFVDRVLERRDGPETRAIVTEWDVPTDGWWFAGHFPGHPVLPGVLISEFAFQSAAILMADRSPAVVGPAAVPVLVGVERARYRRMVGPGATLRAEVTLDDELSGKHDLTARITQDGDTVARLSFSVALAQAPAAGRGA
jgi:3-hydroxyacyl-[acyl-carrier-protein] dehydratase